MTRFLTSLAGPFGASNEDYGADSRFQALAAILLGVWFVSAVPACAKPPTQHRGDARHQADQRDILVTGSKPQTSCGPSSRQIDYACLNGELQHAADAAQSAPPASDAITAEATTPSRVGTFSHTATAQRMGSNLGKSAQPYRPPAPAYTNPVRGAPPR